MVYSPISFLYFQILCNFKLNTSLNSIIPYLLKSLIAEGKDHWRYTSYFSTPWALKADRTSIWFTHFLLNNYLRPNFLTCTMATQCKCLPFRPVGTITWDHLCKTPIKVHCSLNPNFTPHCGWLPHPVPHSLFYHNFLRKYLQGVVSGVVGVGSGK